MNAQDQTPEPTATRPTDHEGPTQQQRWLKYGLNVAVLILAVLVIVILLNWIGYNHFVRFDFTSSGLYSLSPQTKKLLNEIDAEVRFTALYAEGTMEPELLRRIEELLTEYARRSPNITFRRLDPTLRPDEATRFVRGVLGRFEDELSENRAALGEARRAFEAARAFAQTQNAELAEVLSMLGDRDQDLAALLNSINRYLLLLRDSFDQAETRIDQVIEATTRDPDETSRTEAADTGPLTSAGELGEVEQVDVEAGAERQPPTLPEQLPDFNTARTLARRPLTQFQDLLRQAIDQFNRVIDDPNTSDAVRDAILRLREEYRQLRQRIDDALAALDELRSGDYDEFRRNVLRENSLIVTIDRPAGETESGADDSPGVVVLPITDIYPSLTISRISAGQVSAEEGYKGEEAITGAIVRLAVEHDIRVVFVNPSPQPVLGGRGQLTHSIVAERLRKMNFQVEEWQPGGGMGFGGRPTPGGPKPVAEPGQTMIFIALPAPPPNPQMPQAAPAGQMAAQAVQEHVAAGRPALIFLAPSSPLTGAAQTQQLQQVLDDYGISPQSSRVILSSFTTPDGRSRTVNQIELDDWPRDHPAARAMRGLSGVLLQAVPLDLPAQPPPEVEGLRQWPLIRTPADTWADTEFFPGQADQAEKDPSDPTGPFTVAAAASRDGNRLIVIGDRLWASDMVAGYSPAMDMSGRPLYIQYPANAELFINGVYWLAGLDDLIAPGAQTLDVRRLQPIERPALIALWWVVLGGVPALCLGAGAVVWFLRRG